MNIICKSGFDYVCRIQYLIKLEISFIIESQALTKFAKKLNNNKD